MPNWQEVPEGILKAQKEGRPSLINPVRKISINLVHEEDIRSTRKPNFTVWQIYASNFEKIMLY